MMALPMGFNHRTAGIGPAIGNRHMALVYFSALSPRCSWHFFVSSGLGLDSWTCFADFFNGV